MKGKIILFISLLMSILLIVSCAKKNAVGPDNANLPEVNLPSNFGTPVPIDSDRTVEPADTVNTVVVPPGEIDALIRQADNIAKLANKIRHFSPAKRDAVMLKLWERLDEEKMIKLSDAVTGFSYDQIPSDLAKTLGQYYPTQWKFPFCGSWQISCGYGCGKHINQDYNAIDWNLPGWSDYGQIVVAPADGWVVWGGYYGAYGMCLIINHGNNVFSRIAHLLDDKWLIRQCKYIRQGEIIGSCGNTGGVSPHIHFSVHENASWGGGGRIIGSSIRQNGISGQWDLVEWRYYPSNQRCACGL